MLMWASHIRAHDISEWLSSVYLVDDNMLHNYFTKVIDQELGVMTSTL